MPLPSSGTISVGQIQNEFALPTGSMREMTQSTTDVFLRTGPATAGSTVAPTYFYSGSGRTTVLYPQKSTTDGQTGVNTPDRYGWSLANYSGFYHAEQGVNTAGFGSVTRYSGLIGNSLVGIVAHDRSDETTFFDTHLEIFTTSSSNSGWTYMDVKLLGDYQYQPPGYIRYTFARADAEHFGQVGGLGNVYQPTNVVYAWTFTHTSSSYYSSEEHTGSNISVRNFFNNLKSASTGTGLAIPSIRFR